MLNFGKSNALDHEQEFTMAPSLSVVPFIFLMTKPVPTLSKMIIFGMSSWSSTVLLTFFLHKCRRGSNILRSFVITALDKHAPLDSANGRVPTVRVLLAMVSPSFR